MTNVVDLATRRAAAKEAEGPHNSGTVLCLACKYEWQAVAPCGVYQLECPSCHTQAGVWAAPIGLPHETYTVFTCGSCGGQHFALARHESGRWFFCCRSCAHFVDLQTIAERL